MTAKRPEIPHEVDGSLVARFVDLSQGDDPPDLFAFIRQHHPSPADQLEIVLFDQARRSQAGELMRAERYLAELPALNDDASSRLDVVYSEVRCLGRDREAVLDVLRRFPDLREPLSRQLEVAEWIADRETEECDHLAPTLAAPAPSETREIQPARANPDAIDAPLTLDDYELNEQLGAGGMGTVHRARQRSLDRAVAIKLLRPATGTLHNDSASRFVREARAVAQLKHPHIVGVHGIGRTEANGYFLVMELIDGHDLRRYVKQPLPVRQVVEWMVTIADAIDHAHSRGIIHRDLKPGNILIGSDGRPMVTDFGLARLVNSHDDEPLTRDGDILGTPSYMAPEQADSRFGVVDQRTDIYGLGAVMYALLAGHAPVAGKEVARVLAELISDNPVESLSTRRADIPVQLAEICDRCLNKDPARRYESANALAVELRRWLAGEPARDVKQPALAVNPAVDGASDDTNTSGNHASDGRSGRLETTRLATRARRAIQVAAIVLLVLAGWAVFKSGDAGPTNGAPSSDSDEGITGRAGELAAIPDQLTWSVDVYRDGQAGARLALLESPGPLSSGDSVRVSLSFSGPTWAYLFWIGSDGSVTRIFPPADDEGPQRARRELAVPANPGQGLPVYGPDGSEVIVLVLRSSPAENVADIERSLSPPRPFTALPPNLLIRDGLISRAELSASALAALDRLSAPSRAVGVPQPLREDAVSSEFADWHFRLPKSIGEVRYIAIPHVRREPASLDTD